MGRMRNMNWWRLQLFWLFWLSRDCAYREWQDKWTDISRLAVRYRISEQNLLAIQFIRNSILFFRKFDRHLKNFCSDSVKLPESGETFRFLRAIKQKRPKLHLTQNLEDNLAVNLD